MTLILTDGPFQGKEAILVTGCDCVLVSGETCFCVKDGRIIAEIEYDQRDLQHIYDLLTRRET